MTHPLTEDITMDNGDFLHNHSKVTRIEVIGAERELVRYGCANVQVSLQDDGQTLKIFYDWDSEDEAALVELIEKRLTEDGDYLDDLYESHVKEAMRSQQQEDNS